MKQYLLILTVLCTGLLFGQNVERVEVEGRMIANDNDVENVTVFNTSSNQGAVTDDKGMFKIAVALNDVLEISALQFETIHITIDENTISSKKLTLFLVEHINKLNEVLILPYGLSGNLNKDLETVRTYNPDLDAIYFGLANIDEYEFPDDHLTSVENDAMLETHRLRYGFNFGAVFGLLMKETFKGEKRPKGQNGFKRISIENKALIDVYTLAFISDSFNIPESQVNEFLAYVEKDEMDESLFEEGNEVYLLEFLSTKSKEFLSNAGSKD